LIAENEEQDLLPHFNNENGSIHPFFP